MKPSPKIWLVGATGMLGSAIAAELDANNIPFAGTGSKEVDITSEPAVNKFADSFSSLRWIINCAAHTAVDLAESEPDKAYAINATGAANLAKAAVTAGARLIHFSTDYVFDGESARPYSEEDPVNPLGVYGATKLEGERLVIAAAPDSFIFRISWLYGPNGKNFVTTMLRLFEERDELKIVDDQIGSPTHTVKLAENVVGLVSGPRKPGGVYHYSDSGAVSWYEFAVAIAEISIESGLLTKAPTIVPVPSSEFPTPAKRPSRSIMDKSKVETILGFEVNDWRRNLKNFLNLVKTDSE